MKILVVGNCQSETLRQLLDVADRSIRVERLDIAKVTPGSIPFQNFRFTLLQDHPRLAQEIKRTRQQARVLRFPNINFNGYHPDMLGLRAKGSDQPALRVSSIALWSFYSNLAIAECLALYSQSFVDQLNYRDIFKLAKREFIKTLDQCGMPGAHYFDKWHAAGPFMMNVGHPKLFVMKDLAAHLCRQMDIPDSAVDAEMLVVNQGRRGDIFPTYNEARAGGNHLLSRDARYLVNLKAYDLAEFVQRCYAALSSQIDRLELPLARFDIFKRAVEAHSNACAQSSSRRVNPYSGLPPANFWSSMVGVSADQVSPTAAPSPMIGANSKVATAGSCFAQHISRTLSLHGLNYYVVEAPPEGLSDAEAARLQYGLFSARYGNIYTARQLLQLAQSALGRWTPAETSWQGKSGRLIDPYRPNVGDEFEAEASLLEARAGHLDAVRTMLKSMDVLVFTLGLTEAWMNRRDGAVFPVAPGVVSLHADYRDYCFKNFTQDEVVDDMTAFLGLLAEENPKAKVLLTVSPVPLIATYETDHVLAATTYSKSVLRAAASALSRAFSNVEYFPSYEIITGAYARGKYYGDDLRSIRPEGVEHVMRVFMNTLVSTGSSPAGEPAPTPDAVETPGMMEEIKGNSGLVCDEELIVANR